MSVDLDPPLGAVFVDLDDTLYDYRLSVRRSLERIRSHPSFHFALKGWGVGELEELYHKAVLSIPYAQRSALVFSRPLEYRRLVWRRLLSHVGRDPELADPIASEWERGRGEDVRSSAFEGALETLSELSTLLPLGVITNGPSLLQRGKIEALGLGRWVRPELLLVSEEVGVSKPSQEIFLEASRRASVPPHLCLHVGDSPDLDLPAQSIGFRTILFNGTGSPEGSPDPWSCDLVSSSWIEIREWILQRI